MNLASIFNSLTLIIILMTSGLASAESLRVDCIDEKLQEIAKKFFTGRLKPDTSEAEQKTLLEVFKKRGGMESIELLKGNDPSWTIRIIPQEKIRELHFVGNRYLSRNQLLTAMPYVQETLNFVDELDKYQKNLEKIYQSSGFPEVAINIDKVSFPNAWAELIISIQENRPLLLKNFELNGDITPLTRGEVLHRLKADNPAHFDPSLIKANIEALRKHYVALGFRSAQISAGEPKIKLDDLSVSFQVDINRGPKVEVNFLTEKYFFLDRDSLLKKAIGLDEENRFSKGYLEEATDRLKEYYYEQGYAHPKVEYHDRLDGNANIRFIDFIINKGIRTKIRQIHFQLDSNPEIPNKKLQSMLDEIEIGDPYDRSKFRTSANHLRSQLQEIGYHDASEVAFDELISADGKFVDLQVNLALGQRYIFGKTDLEIDEAAHTPTTKSLNAKTVRDLIRYRIGRPFIVSQYEQSLTKMRNYCRNLGYRFCEIEQALSPGEQPNVKNIRIHITTGKQYRFGAILVQGSRTTEDYVIEREVKFRSNDLYSPDEIEESQRAIQRLGFFSSVQIEEFHDDKEKQIVDMLIKVREKKPRSIRFKVGYGSDEGARLSTDFSYLNIGGTGRNVYLSAGVSRRFPGEIIEGRVVANYIEPHLLDSPLDGRVQFSYQRNEEEFGNLEKTGAFLGVEYNDLLWIQDLFRWEVEFREPFDLKIPATDLSPFDQSRRLFGSLGNTLTLDFRDDPFNPTFGYFGQILSNYYSEAFLSEEEFYQVFSRNSFYLPIYKLVSLTLSLRVGFSATFGSTAAQGNDLIPIEKRFRLGGSQSLRGFTLDSVGGQDSNTPASNSNNPAPGGNSVFNYMAEVGFPLPGGFRLVGFTDGGNAFVLNDDFDPLDIRQSAGFGLRYVTPIGPLRLDFGFKLDKKPGESVGELHFAVGLF